MDSVSSTSMFFSSLFQCIITHHSSFERVRGVIYLFLVYYLVYSVRAHRVKPNAAGRRQAGRQADMQADRQTDMA